MKKNFIAVCQKAVNLLNKTTVVFILLFAVTATVNAQSYNYFSKNNSSTLSRKGPFDVTLENTVMDAPPPPAITYTPLTSTCATGNRTLTTTITDADGVPTSGAGLPVLYWRINSGTYTAVTATFAAPNQYSFVFGSGATAGNLVSYYIVAQDNSGNTGAQPSAGAGGYTTNPPAAATPPSSPEFYVIQTTLAPGTYNVGAGQTYLTLTDAVNAYNNSCLIGAVTFLLMDANYSSSEVFPITISNPAANATNTLTIKPAAGISPIIQGSASDAIIKLNGADYITIEGSNTGGTTRNLSIINNSTGLTSTVVWLGSASASNGATHNTIKNCVVTGSGTNATLAGIVSSSGVIAGNVAEAGNTDNTYLNNAITTSYYGMIVVGPVAGEVNTVINGNTIGSTQTTKKLGYRGILISNQTNMLVSNNIVQGIVSSIGIGSDSDPTGGIIVSGVISGGSIFSNLVNDIKNTNVGGWPAYGISLQSSSTAANLKIYNNFIHSIVGNGNTSTPGQNGIGIAVLSGAGYGIYFNSINLFAAQIAAAGGISSCLFIGSGVTGTASLDIRDNIFSITRPPGSAGVNYAVYSSVPNIVFNLVNFNDYYSNGFVGFLGSNRLNIAAWQTATGQDGNSVAVNPIFVSTTDLHLQLISSLNDQGTPIAGITTDIDATTRSTTVPDIGGDEFTPPVCSGNNGGTVTSDFINVCSSGKVSLVSTGFAYGLGIAYQWEFSTTGPSTGFANLPGETNPTSANPPVITQNTWYRLKVRCAAGADGYSPALLITVYDPHILSTVPASRCGPGTVSLSATGTATTAIQWYTTATGGAPVYTGNPFVTPPISATTTYYAESTYLGSSGTVGKPVPTLPNNGVNTGLTTWDMQFNVIQATKLLTLDVYPLVSGENSTIDVYNSVGTIIASVFYTTVVSGGNTAQTVTMNVSLPIGNGYYLYATGGIPTSGLTRDLSGASYPYNSSDIVITGNQFSPSFYMYYYNWRFSNGCSSSPRSAVTATVGTTATLNMTSTPHAICAGSCTNLNVTSSNPSFVYTWTPGPLTGAAQTVCPLVTTTYTLNATDGTCTAKDSITIDVNPASSNVLIAPSAIVKCGGSSAVLLTASGGDISAVDIIKQDFNDGTPGVSTDPSGGWTIENTSNLGTITNAAWTYRQDQYVYGGNTFRSNDNTTFFMTNSGAQGGGTSGRTRTVLKSPSFSLAGYTSASLYFYYCYSAFGSPIDSVTVEYSNSGSSWTKLKSYLTSRGASNAFRKDTISLTPYVGATVNYIRFRYYADHGFFFVIDNISVVGANLGTTPITWSPTAGLYTNIAATAPYAYTGGATTTIYANPSTTTTYTATATPVNACQKSQTIDVTIRQLTGAISGPSSVCPSGAANMSIALTGTGPWNLTYTDGTTPVTVNNIATQPYTFIVNPLTTTTYTLTALSDAFCTATAGNLGAPFTVTVNPSVFSTWVGLSSDWNDPSNWCGGIPTASKDVSIPLTSFQPVIALTTAVARDISLSGGATLTINAAASLSFKGNFVNNGVIINNGSLVMNGTTVQAFPGGTTGTITAMNILEVNNTAGVTINKAITITGMLKPTAGNITLNNAIVTLHSGVTATASVSALGGSAGFTYTGTGKFSIERYVSTPSNVGWKFLAAPLRSDATETIHQAWQEGQAAGATISTGYGMQIVGPGGVPMGFDMANSITSLKTFNALTGAWVTIPGTNTPITSTQGYMTFVRGDRASNSFGSSSPTTLRMSGPINTGAMGPYSTTVANQFISVGNPYPSAVNFNLTTKNGLIDVYYLWDPELGNFGGYQTFTGPSYNPVPGGGSYPTNKFIESGTAFFVVANAAAVPHNISFAETNKVNTSFQVQRTNTITKELRTKLFAVAATGANLTDGILIEFDPAYSNEVDDLDAPKLSNFGENIGILTKGKTLSVERHAEIINTDTIFFQLGQLRQQAYQMEFTAQNLAAPGLTAYLEDSYLHTSTVINLNIVSTTDFIVNTDAASRAADRFRLVFIKLRPVPVTFTNVIAYRQDKNIMVSWKVENQINIVQYEIERSVEGSSFSKIAVQNAKANGAGTSLQYNQLDVVPFAGDNFYRIKSVGLGNDIKYSEIVKVSMPGEASLIAVYPNPVKDNTIRVSFNNVPKANYAIRLFGMNSQLIYQQNLDHPGGSQRVMIPVPEGLAKGVYNLEINLTSGKKRTFKVVID